MKKPESKDYQWGVHYKRALTAYYKYLDNKNKELIGKERPWICEELKDWSIVGMNHYHTGGIKQLFVAMVKDGTCIIEEGIDSVEIWERLIEQALKADKK